jgi:hypothetical protein
MIAVIVARSGRCYDCTATCAGGGACAFNSYITAATVLARAATTAADYLRDLEAELSAYEKYLRSRAWMPAPRVIKAPAPALIYTPLFTRRIAPPFWTGKNYRKQK